MEEISWKAEEFEYVEKSTDWYWTVGIISVVLIVGAILLENILFALLIFIATVTLVLHAIKKPDIVTFRLTSKGVYIDTVLFPYQTLDSFWVEHNEHEQKILLRSKKALMPYIVIPIEDVHPDEVRAFLLAHLDEEFMEEPFSQEIMKMLGF